MNDQNDTFEIIEKYLSGELSTAEQTAFEKKMQEDESFAQAVEKQKLTHKALDLYSQLKTNERVKSIYQEELKSAKSRKRQLLSIAAGIAVLISISWAYIFASMNYSDEAILANSFEPYPDRITTMGTPVNALIAEGMHAYNESDYEKVIGVFSQVPDTLEQFDLIRLYNGIAQFETGKLTTAIKSFQELESVDNNFSEVARWYLALSYLKTENKEASRLILEQIIRDKSFQSEKAKDILDKINHPFRKLPGVK